MNKLINIDWDSYPEVSKLGNMVKSRLGEINPNRISKRKFFGNVFEACTFIYNEDTSKHYTDLVADSERKFYVYAHLDTSRKVAIGKHPKSTFAGTLGMQHIPFYIGKGTGDRAYDLNRNDTHRKIRQFLKAQGLEVAVHIIKDNLTEKEAFCYEDKLIDIFGLKVYGGYLVNLDEGYYPIQRRKLYEEQYSLMARKVRQDKGSIPLRST